MCSSLEHTTPSTIRQTGDWAFCGDMCACSTLYTIPMYGSVLQLLCIEETARPNVNQCQCWQDPMLVLVAVL